MSGNIVSRRATLAWAFAFSSAAGFRGAADAAQTESRSSLEEKNLQTILAWWKTWEGDPPSAQAIVAPFADDCVIRDGQHAQIGVEGKRAATALIESYLHGGARRARIDVTRTFVSGPMVITEYNAASRNKDEPPRLPDEPCIAMFILKQGKIWCFIQISRTEV